MLCAQSFSPRVPRARRALLSAGLTLALFSPAATLPQDTRGLQPVAPAPGDVSAGNYYALVIGINDYPSLPHLTTAVNDARAVGALLESNFGFSGHVTYLLNEKATRAGIMDALEGPGGYGQTLSESDNLLIYYAGHGYNNTRTDKAYWQPYDADSFHITNQISADDLTTAIRGIASHHVLIISDSCFSGDLTRGVDDDLPASRGEDAFLRRMLSAPSRNLLSSGGNEPVSDAGPEGHSVFAAALLRALADQPGPLFTAADLADPVKKMVRAHSGQVPEYFRIGNSMPRNFPIDIGDFVFTRPASSAAAPPPSGPTPAVPVSAPASTVSAPASDEYAQAIALLNAKKYARAAPILTSACNQGNLEACIHLGILYGNGDGVTRDPARMAALYRKACDGNSADGCNGLGTVYEYGLGVEKDCARAAILYRKSCDGGFPEGCHTLGKLYEWGARGCFTKDPSQAAPLYRRACELGSEEACSDLTDFQRSKK
jgi:hypothetical protein